MPGHPDFELVHIDGTRGPIYLPRADVIARLEQVASLSKAQRRATSGGRLFQNFRTTTYSTGPGLEKPQDGAGLPFATLRRLADTSPIDRLIIDTRVMQMKRFARRSHGLRELGFRVRHVRHNDPEFDVPDNLDRLARQIEDVILSPTAPFHNGFRDIVTITVEEELTIDRKAMVITRDQRGRPIRYHLLDGATIRPVAAVIFEAIQKEYQKDPSEGRVLGYEEMAYRLSEQSGWDLMRAAYVQVVDAQIVGAWRDTELSIDITHPTARLNWWGYGRSSLERSASLSTSFISAWAYNNQLFTTQYPEAILAVIGEYDEEGLEGFRRKVLGEGRQDNSSQRLPVIEFDDAESSKLQLIKLRDTPKDMLYEHYLSALIKLKCAAYRMHPSLINFSTDAAQGSIVFQSNASQADQIALSQEEGLRALHESIADWLTRTIVADWHPDLAMVWDGIDNESEDAVVQRIEREIQGGFMTLDEGRRTRGRKPYPKKAPTKVGDYSGGAYLQAISMVQQAEQAAQQAEQQAGYDDGDFGDGETPPPWMAQGGQQQGQPPQQGPPGAPQQQGGQQGGPQHLNQEAAIAGGRQPLQRSLTISLPSWPGLEETHEGDLWET